MTTAGQTAGSRRGRRAVSLFGDLVRVVHGISQEGARLLRAEGMTPAQYLLLVEVDSHQDRSQQQLSDRLGVTKGNVSMLITRLEEAGLLRRHPEGAAHAVRLTEAGRTRLAHLRPLHARFLAERLGALDEAEMDELARLLAAIDRAG